MSQRFHRVLFLLPVLLLGAASPPRAGAQTAALPPVPTIEAGRSFGFQTLEGVTYVLEGSHSSNNWVTVVEPIFGDGAHFSALLPTGTPDYAHWRVRPVDGAAYGPAVTELGGRSLALNEGGRPRQVIFFPEIAGVKRGILKTDATHARSFIWKIRRTAGAKSVAELTYKDGTRSTVEMDFLNGKVGSYRMRDFNAAGGAEVTEGGGFSLHHGRIRDLPGQAVLPVTMAGQQVLLEEGGSVTLLEFQHNGRVTVTQPDGHAETVDYEYNRPQPNKAELKIEPSQASQIMQMFQMQVSSQATGNFTRIPMVQPGNVPVPGVLPQPGTFNIPTDQLISNSTNGPPASLGGKVLELNGDGSVKLTFHEDGTGTASKEDNGSVEVSFFNYNYAPTDEDEASLALTFPGASTDRVEDYNLDFSSGSAGSYEVSSFEGGELAQTSSGSFDAGGGGN